MRAVPETVVVLAILTFSLVGGVCNRVRGGYWNAPPVLDDGVLTHDGPARFIEAAPCALFVFVGLLK